MPTLVRKGRLRNALRNAGKTTAHAAKAKIAVAATLAQAKKSAPATRNVKANKPFLIRGVIYCKYECHKEWRNTGCFYAFIKI
jgi:hypothetical protein